MGFYSRFFYDKILCSVELQDYFLLSALNYTPMNIATMAEGEVTSEFFIIVESEMNKPSAVVCQSCLATDRRLIPLLHLQETLDEIKLNDVSIMY